jgi:hypothetical protein
MAQKHSFIFSPGKWLGTGTITFSMSTDKLKFFTRWTIDPEKNGVIRCVQKTEIEGGGDQVVNILYFNVEGKDKDNFLVRLENPLIGAVQGKGVSSDQSIGWEFRAIDLGFDGFEIYELQDSENYFMRGEYASDDQSRTVIEGKIWLEGEK